MLTNFKGYEFMYNESIRNTQILLFKDSMECYSLKVRKINYGLCTRTESETMRCELLQSPSK